MRISLLSNAFAVRAERPSSSIGVIREFDREAAYGMRLDIPSGTAVRFEPGDEKEVQLIDIRGCRKVYGLNDLVNGCLDHRKCK